MHVIRALFLAILFVIVTVILNALAIMPKSASAQMGADSTTQASITAISTGGGHTCVLTPTGGVKCWGTNLYGQLGDGTTTDRYMPVDVSGLSTGATAIAAGSMHTCVLVNGGGVKCWGENNQGQLGDGTTTDRYTPVDVSGLSSEVTAITAGSSHTCALMSNGGVKCWGENSHGQLGDGTTTGRYTPVSVSGLGSSVTVIAAGAGYTCAITSNDGVKCWGINNFGQLGDGTTTDRYIPVDVSGLGNGVTTISVGGEHTCAVESSGSVKCWGANGEGQLGDGTTTVRYAPVNVAGLSIDVTAVTAGGRHTCALMIGGGAKCWGSNYHGELGDGTSGSSRLTAINVAGLISGVVAIDAGFSFTCAIVANGGIRCWGEDSDGKLGNNMQTYFRFAPTEVSTLTSEVNSVTAGERHTCARTSAGGVLCWGDQPLLGDGIDEGRFVPVAVAGLASGVTAIAAGGEGGEGGEGHTCALTASGTAHCWGGNFYRQLGTGTEYNGPRLLPVVVTGLGSGGVSAIAPGDAHTCAIITGGSVYCWGTIGGVFPAVVSGLIGTASAISSGYGYSCALTTEGVFCWGTNRYGQLGDGTTLSRSTPVAVNGLSTGVTSVATGFLHTCARTNAGGVKCWGSNASGELGDGTTTDRLTPVDVVGMTSGIGQVTVGGNHSCALTSSGGVLCWGLNDRGQLGDGTTTAHLTPVQVSGLDTGIASISAGAHHTCAVTTSGSVKCWGANSAGQLGVNPGWAPVDVIFPGSPPPPLDGQQILGNPSWEAGEDPRVDSRWQWRGVSSADDCFAWTYDSTDPAGPAADGNRFLATSRKGGANCISLYQDIERYPLMGETYTFEIAARAPTNLPEHARAFDLQVFASDGSGRVQAGERKSFTVNQNAWTYHRTAITIDGTRYKFLRVEVYLMSQDSQEINFNFDAARLVGPGHISGRILYPAIEPIPGATVEMHTAAGSLVAVATTDADGLYVLPVLKSGTYVLQAKKVDHEFTATQCGGINNGATCALSIADVSDWPGQNFVSSYDAPDQVSDNTSEAVVDYSGTTFGDSVRADGQETATIRITLRNDQGQPVPGQQLTLRRAPDSKPDDLWVFGTILPTDTNGKTEILVRSLSTTSRDYVVNLYVNENDLIFVRYVKVTSVQDWTPTDRLQQCADTVFKKDGFNEYDVISDIQDIANLGDYFRQHLVDEGNDFVADHAADVAVDLMGATLFTSPVADDLLFPGVDLSGLVQAPFVVNKNAFPSLVTGSAGKVFDAVKPALPRQFKDPAPIFTTVYLPNLRADTDRLNNVWLRAFQQFLSSTPSLPPGTSEVWKSDLQARKAANDVILSSIFHSSLLLNEAKRVNNYRELSSISLDILKSVVQQYIPAVLQSAFDLTSSAIDLESDFRIATEDARYLLLALTAFRGHQMAINEAHANCHSALGFMKQGTLPQIPSLDIVSVRPVLETVSTGLFSREKRVALKVEVRNNENHDTSYILVVDYAPRPLKASLLLGVGRVDCGLRCVQLPAAQKIVIKTIPAHQTAVIDAEFLGEDDPMRGISPKAGKPLTYYVLAHNQFGLYQVHQGFVDWPASDTRTVKMTADVRQPLIYPSITSLLKPTGPSLSNNFTAMLLIENPYPFTVTTVISQPIPHNATIQTVVNGTVEGQNLVWRMEMPGNALTSAVFEFTLSGEPQTSVRIPSAVLTFATQPDGLLLHDVSNEGAYTHVVPDYAVEVDGIYLPMIQR